MHPAPRWLFAERPLAFLAEDDPDVQVVLKDFLDVVGYDVLAVSDGADLLDALARSTSDTERDPDVLVIDVRMPGLNGLSVAEELRADGWRQPIIIISCYAYDELLLSRIARLPRVAFFAKPFSPEDLCRVISSLRMARSPTPAAFFVK